MAYFEDSIQQGNYEHTYCDHCGNKKQGENPPCIPDSCPIMILHERCADRRPERYSNPESAERQYLDYFIPTTATRGAAECKMFIPKCERVKISYADQGGSNEKDTDDI